MNFTMPKATGPDSFPQKIAVIGDLGQVRSCPSGRPISEENGERGGLLWSTIQDSHVRLLCLQTYNSTSTLEHVLASDPQV